MDRDKKRDLLEKAVEASTLLMKRAEDSKYPESLFYANHVLGLVLPMLALIEPSFDRKEKLLEEALEHRTEALRFTEQFTPFVFWNRGIELSSLARIKSRLAELVKDSEAKRKLFEEAVIDMERALGYAVKELAFYERKGSAPSLFPTIARDQYVYGRLLIRLYEFTCNRENLRKSIAAFEDAAHSYQKADNVSRTAEIYWRTGQVYSTLGDHLKSAESFDTASDYYKKAAEKISQLRDFYQDHALYMQAWSEIEKARHHHSRQEYSLAEEHFDKAATIHKSLKRWRHMASNYSAWTQVEHAEELSRKEQSEEAIRVFQQAARLFQETRKSLQSKLGDVENPAEEQTAKNMIKATELRDEYCKGRIILEEARILDKKGDHYSSSEKYDSASRIFEEIAEALELEQDKKELKLVAALSQAWSKMTKGEAEESPNLYIQASQLFEQAKELSPNEKTRMLVSGHSRFCKALEAGTKFGDTKDQKLHAAFMQHMESASNYYVKAGFRTASEYAKATKLLFEAYVYMDNAQSETDPEKKAKLYAVADKVLQTSAGSFTEAEHPEKREQVLRLLQKVKDERELALSLSDVLHAPSIVSTTAAFATPSPNQENAVGLERFENADIHANTITRQKELKVGENLDFEIELVNAGKGSAQLIKLMGVIPDGFDLVEKPDAYRVEDGYLNMKGKRLGSLKTEEIRLVLRPRVQGVFPLRPKVLYLDESGKYKGEEPEPVTVTVKELGIKGWLKGER
jgi:tetratricopeptide (TPR) repeat protein